MILPFHLCGYNTVLLNSRLGLETEMFTRNSGLGVWFFRKNLKLHKKFCSSIRIYFFLILKDKEDRRICIILSLFIV